VLNKGKPEAVMGIKSIEEERAGGIESESKKNP